MTDENDTKPLPPEPVTGGRPPLRSARETASPAPSPDDGVEVDGRPAGNADKRKRSSRSGGERQGKRDQAGRRPTPARTMPKSEAPVAVEPDTGQVQLEVDGKLWTVTVLGRAGGGAATPLLLLGFRAADEQSAVPTLEALVVGKTLSGISESRLEVALASASSSPGQDTEGRG